MRRGPLDLCDIIRMSPKRESGPFIIPMMHMNRMIIPGRGKYLIV